jgi:Xaa-Pro aminopeptidase
VTQLGDTVNLKRPENTMSAHDRKRKLTQLRNALQKLGCSGMIVPRTDEFQGEYVPASAERLRWLTGFSGSWGSAIIGKNSAALIVDGRYTIQAANETAGLNIELLAPDAKSFADYLSKTFKAKHKIAFDPWLATVSEAKRLNQVADKIGLTLVPLSSNPIDAIWIDRPLPPSKPVSLHPLKYAGETAASKIAKIAEIIRASQADAFVLTDPLAVAWAFNIRGADIPHTPAALVRAIITNNGKAMIFVDADRLESSILPSIGKSLSTKPPSALATELKTLGKQKRRVAFDPSNCPDAIRVMLQKAGAFIVESVDPCTLPRACKNKTEQSGARAAHLRDGAAMCNFLFWLQAQKPDGALTEKSAQEHLLHCRQATGKLIDLSFGSISASGPNAAQPHYHVQKGQGRKLRSGEIYLIDSGGQYRGGTTDITRTTIIGDPTAAMKKHFTLVLKGMIAVSVAHFPVGTTGVQLDALARASLWQHGYDFDHGTGHGVGSFLSVHEGPARISKTGSVALEPGMILSNEPGYYRKGKYGIRIENLLLVKPAQKPRQGDRFMLSFETLSFAPINKRLIDTSLLTRSELQWLDAYHADVLQKLGSKVHSETLPWLQEVCAALT